MNRHAEDALEQFMNQHASGSLNAFGRERDDNNGTFEALITVGCAVGLMIATIVMVLLLSDEAKPPALQPAQIIERGLDRQKDNWSGWASVPPQAMIPNQDLLAERNRRPTCRRRTFKKPETTVTVCTARVVERAYVSALFDGGAVVGAPDLLKENIKSLNDRGRGGIAKLVDRVVTEALL